MVAERGRHPGWALTHPPPRFLMDLAAQEMGSSSSSHGRGGVPSVLMPDHWIGFENRRQDPAFSRTPPVQDVPPFKAPEISSMAFFFPCKRGSQVLEIKPKERKPHI